MDEQSSHFRTTEIEDLPLERGSFRFLTLKSPALNQRADLLLFLPDQVKTNANGNLPVITLLHGVYGSHWVWALKGKAHESLQRLIDADLIPPCILAMPSDGLWGDGSSYCEHSGMHFEKWISEDVPFAVAENTENDIRSKHFISGLSMGGYGALRIGAKYPEKYTAFSGHSSITQFEQLELFVEEPLGKYQNHMRPSVFEQIIENKNKLRPFRFDCGVNDELIQPNRKLNEQLLTAGIRHTYEEFDGGHEWPYWIKHIESTYRFFANFM